MSVLGEGDLLFNLNEMLEYEIQRQFLEDERATQVEKCGCAGNCRWLEHTTGIYTERDDNCIFG